MHFDFEGIVKFDICAVLKTKGSKQRLIKKHIQVVFLNTSSGNGMQFFSAFFMHLFLDLRL